MARYTEIYKLDKPLYAQYAPVVIRKTALFYDSQKQCMQVFCKIQNITDKTIKSASVTLRFYDRNGNVLGGETSYSYEDVCASYGTTFGEKTPISSHVDNACKCVVTVSEVLFDEGGAWLADSDTKWGILRAPTLIRDKLDSHQLVAYRERFGEGAKYAYEKRANLQICTCGAINDGSMSRCPICGSDFLELENLDRAALKKEGYYRTAVLRMDNGCNADQLLKLKSAFESLGDYKDSKSKISEIEARLEKIYEEKAAVKAVKRAKSLKVRAVVKKVSIFSGIAAVFIAIITTGIILATLSHTIGYNLNGGTFRNEKTDSYTLLTSDIALENPTREGYTFVGWTGTGLDTPTVDVTIPMWSFGSRFYTANWQANSYTVTFDSAGGSSVSARTVTFGEQASLPTPSRVGYYFMGWYAGNKQYVSGNVWTKALDVKLTARWSARNYTVTFDDIDKVFASTTVTFNLNYSNSVNTVVELNNGDTLTYPTPPTRSGYAFAGWYTDSSCTTKFNFSETITEDITLYAKWQAMSSSYNTREYVDIANYNSGSSKKTFSVSANYSSSPDYYYFTFYEDGSYTIYANRTSGDFYITVYNATQNSTIISSYNMYSSYSSKSASFTANAGDVIYIKLYKYGSSSSNGAGTFYVSGASYPTSTATASSNVIDGYVYNEDSSDSQTVTFGSQYTLLTPTRPGYFFCGWYSGNTKVETGAWNIAGDVTLTPVWEEIVYYDVTFNDVVSKVKVTYNYSYSGSNTVVELNNGDTLTYPAPPTRSGYAFAGWYTDSSCTTKFNFSETITEDITLYAKWQAMSSSYNTREYVDIVSYASSSQQKSITASSYSSYNYYYFTCYKDGTYTIYGTWTEGDFKFNVSNVTKGTTIIDDYNLYSQQPSMSQSFTANAGDVICVRTIRYSAGFDYLSNGKFYVVGASYPISTAVAQCSETSGMEYSYGDSVTIQAGYGAEFTLPTVTRTGYTFLGWYNGNTKVESGTWEYDYAVTLTPRWE